MHLAGLKAHQQATAELEVGVQRAQAALDAAVDELSRRMWDEERARAPVASGAPSREAPPSLEEPADSADANQADGGDEDGGDDARPACARAPIH